MKPLVARMVKAALDDIDSPEEDEDEYPIVKDRSNPNYVHISGHVDFERMMLAVLAEFEKPGSA